MLPNTAIGSPSKALKSLPTDDQCFLMYFIAGTYFGPDLKGTEPKKSALQRKAEGLPPYTLDQLTGSYIKAVEVERVYFHLLGNADPSVKVKLWMFRQFFQGNCDFTGKNYQQFPDLFPEDLHPHSNVKNKYRLVKNIVFISNPEVSYMKVDDIERFKALTGLQDFCLKINAVPNVVAHKIESRKLKSTENTNAAMIFFPSRPKSEDWANLASATRTGFVISGSAATGQVGPSVGQTDIGECDDSYLFRVSLPGVIRDEREFSCELESNGKVDIRGVTTTGEKKVCRYSQLFEMQSRNLCPPGHFSLSFQLPGPVDPQKFSGDFGTDGVLEGIVMKSKTKN